jgi:hypothetical protein
MIEMLHELSLRKATKIVMFLLTCLSMTGCYTLKTVTFNSIPEKRKILVIHSDKNFWAVDNYSISNGALTAMLCSDSVKIRKSKVVDIYVAPAESVTIDGNQLTVPTMNIGKTDYHALNFWETLGLIAGTGWLLYSFLLPAY